MSRIINPESAGKTRTKDTKIIVLAIREFLKQTTSSDLTRDLIACVLLCLDEIYETIDISVEAWEDRGYWVKADHFRMEWQWTKIMAEKLRPQVLAENYEEIVPLYVEILQALSNVKVSENHRMGTPWTGCWKELTQG